jgi:2,3-bisphosphoglycerate-dependent phosphoglycerate mutase
MSVMATLVLLRHGESEWNSKNLFTGWVDVDLTAKGEAEARSGGRLLRDKGLNPTVLHTSLLTRAIRTSTLALEECGRSWLPVRRSWRLNERHYGALQGKDKKQTLDTYGEEQFLLWRRSYDEPPPPIEAGSEWDNSGEERYARLAPGIVPATECLADVVERMLPYWYDGIVPDLRADETVLVVAHGNSLRGLVMHLDGLTREQVVALNIPTGQPLRYDLDADLRPVVPGGTYLDPEAAAAAAAAVANQGR